VGGTVLFVCPHGAGKSRIAAAWFDALASAGWVATTAGVQPQASVSAHAPRLLAGTPALPFLDRELPRALSAIPAAVLTVAIDCPDGAVAADVSWSLGHGDFGEPMAAELRVRVTELIGSLTAMVVDGGGVPDG
jgi:hypothetical protein